MRRPYSLHLRSDYSSVLRVERLFSPCVWEAERGADLAGDERCGRLTGRAVDHAVLGEAKAEALPRVGEAKRAAGASVAERAGTRAHGGAGVSKVVAERPASDIAAYHVWRFKLERGSDP
jgi:hypothetical protein